MIDMFMTFDIITPTTNTAENGMRVKNIIQNTTAKPSRTWILCSGCKENKNDVLESVFVTASRSGITIRLCVS